MRRIAFAAVASGLIAGLLLTAIQQLQVVPLIRAAEAFEAVHDAAAPSILATLAANIVLASAFALFLGAAMALAPRADWRAGVIWGAAGYVAFFVAPSIGLPPELPGTEAAALHERQLWWAATVTCSAAGLWMVVFGKNAVMRAIGVLLLVSPHVAGAPQPALHHTAAPADLAADFVRATYLANALFWLALGALAGFFNREAPPARPSRSAAPAP